MQLYLHLKQQSTQQNILLLLETAIQISRLFYSPAHNRTPRQILQLYNCTWVHHKLCYELFQKFYAGMTREKMFGLYLHAIVAHAPLQFEILSLSSVNTESQERIFSQARKTVTATSNRHPQNIVSTLTLRLRAKTQLKHISTLVNQGESKVAKVGKSIPLYQGTVIEKSLVERHLSSWNQHLRRISPFLLPGRGVWWDYCNEGYKFSDGEEDQDCNPHGPELLHYRSSTLKTVTERQRECWENLLSSNKELPTPKLLIYSQDGTPCGEQIYSHVPELMDAAPTQDAEHIELNSLALPQQEHSGLASATPTQVVEHTQLNSLALPQQEHSGLASATPTEDVEHTQLNSLALPQQEHSGLASATPSQDVEHTQFNSLALPQQEHSGLTYPHNTATTEDTGCESETRQHLHLGWPEDKCYTEAQQTWKNNWEQHRE